MSSARVTGLRSVDLSKDRLTKGMTAKAVKKSGGPAGTHPHLPLRPPPDRLPLANQLVQERGQQGTHVHPVDRPLVQAQEGNQHVTEFRRGCMSQRVQRVVPDFRMG